MMSVGGKKAVVVLGEGLMHRLIDQTSLAKMRL